MALEKEDMERLNDVFVTRKEYNETAKEIDKKLANDSTRLAVIETKVNQISWLLTAVAGGVITMLIKMFFGG